MKTPEIPEDETTRLATLKSLDILDTAEEERFDRLTRLAKRIFNVPIALVSLIDENRQWFKSCFGLNTRETSRDISFCGHAILDEKIFLIPDASKDERFFDNPLVTGSPYIRFYAGCPLNVLGSRLGTLCIIDTKPRDFKEEDLSYLKDLALMVERELVAVQIATIDELTKVSNRRGFMRLAQSGLNICVRQNVQSALVFFDLNGFKKINDTFGHKEGDIALKTFADIMMKTCRDADVFGRLGGDEFVLWLSDANQEYSEKLIDRFKKSIDDYNKESRRGYDLLFSAGIIEIPPEKNVMIETYLDMADSKMYKQKRKTG